MSPLRRTSFSAVVLPFAAVLLLFPPWDAEPRSISPDSPVEAGLKALRNGDVPLAVTLLRAGVQGSEPVPIQAWFGLGIAYARLERWEASVDAFGQGVGGSSDPIRLWMRYYAATSLARAGREEEADAHLEWILGAIKEGPLREHTRLKQLNWAMADGDRQAEAEVLRALVAERIGNLSGHAERLAALLDDTDPHEARGYRLAALRAPGSDEARGRAAARLLESATPLEPVDLIAVGQALYGLADWSGAIRSFRTALDVTADPDQRVEARYRLGLSLYRGRDWSAAVEAFQGVTEAPGPYRISAAYYQALARSATLRAAEGARVLESFARRYPDSRWAPRALRQAGERLEGVDCAEARRVLEYLMERYPAHWENADALLQLASCARREEDPVRAEQDYLRLARGVFYPQEKAQGWFWAGRLALARGDTATAGSRFERARRDYPDTYYGARAGTVNGDSIEPVGPRVDWIAPAALAAPTWSGPELKAAVALLQVGISSDGSEQLLWALESEPVDHARMYDLWELCIGGGAYGAAVELGDRLRRTTRWAQGDPRGRTLEAPLYYVELILPEAERLGLDPFLIMALIKRESAFRDDARSHVGARGLMQLMPETASEWVRRLRLSDRDVDEESLYEPAFNVQLGIPYLAHLIRQFDGSVEKALAAYNGGPTNVRRWEGKASDGKPETFVEEIGFPETRNYVRGILDTYHRYRYLWSQHTGG